MEPSFLPAYHAPSGYAQPGEYNWGQEQRRRKRQFQSNYRLQDGLFAQQAPVQVDSRHNLSAPQLGSRTGLLTLGWPLHGRQSTLAMQWWHRFCLFLALFCPSCICIMSPQSAAMVAISSSWLLRPREAKNQKTSISNFSLWNIHIFPETSLKHML